MTGPVMVMAEPQNYLQPVVLEPFAHRAIQATVEPPSAGKVNVGGVIV